MKILLGCAGGAHNGKFVFRATTANARRRNFCEWRYLSWRAQHRDQGSGSSWRHQAEWQRLRPLPGRAQAIAVSNGKIIAVGPTEDIQKLKGPKTQVIDLGGHFVMPGFNDAHVHLGSGGFEKLNVDLVGSKSLDDMKQRIAARAKTAVAG